MVAHNKNNFSKPYRNPRIAKQKDEVNPLWETDLICDLANPANSLENLCAAMGISLEALSLWMARPDVAARLDLMQTTAMNRARFIGRLTLPTAAQSAANIINAHKSRPQKPTIDAAFDSDLHRANETMLKAAGFLQRLTAEPAPKSARKSRAPSQIKDSPKDFEVASGAAQLSVPCDGADQRHAAVANGNNSDSASHKIADSNHQNATLSPAPQRKSGKSNTRSRQNSPNRLKKARRPKSPIAPTLSSNASSTPPLSAFNPRHTRLIAPHHAQSQSTVADRPEHSSSRSGQRMNATVSESPASSSTQRSSSD